MFGYLYLLGIIIIVKNSDHSFWFCLLNDNKYVYYFYIYIQWLRWIFTDRIPGYLSLKILIFIMYYKCYWFIMLILDNYYDSSTAYEHQF